MVIVSYPSEPRTLEGEKQVRTSNEDQGIITIGIPTTADGCNGLVNVQLLGSKDDIQKIVQADGSGKLGIELLANQTKR